MTLEELFELLQEEGVENKLSGNLFYEGSYIKWEYDALGVDIEDTIEDHLHIIFTDDLDILKEYIDESIFYISTPEVEETFIFFYIEK